jgi:Na+(H+)/acetate symporter ActP
MIIMLLWNFTHLSFVSRTRQLGEFSFTVGVTMASTRCHAQSHLRFHPVVLPSQVSLPQLISGIAGSGILLQALLSPSLGPINWHVHLVLHHHLYVILANMLRFTSSRLIIPLMSLPPLLNSCIRMCGDLQSRLLVVLSTMLAS